MTAVRLPFRNPSGIFIPFKREFSSDKLGILDVKVRTAGGKSIDIEIQIAAMPEMRSRISYYLSNMITEQIGMGGHYAELKQAISIVITDYDFITETKRYHTVFGMLEQEEEFKMLAGKNPMIQEAYCKLQVMSEDEANRMIYEARLKAQRDDYSRMEGARREGREEIILQMAQYGMDIMDIAAITHLSEQEVGTILKQENR